MKVSIEVAVSVCISVGGRGGGKWEFACRAREDWGAAGAAPRRPTSTQSDRSHRRSSKRRRPGCVVGDRVELRSCWDENSRVGAAESTHRRGECVREKAQGGDALLCVCVREKIVGGAAPSLVPRVAPHAGGRASRGHVDGKTIDLRCGRA